MYQFIHIETYGREISTRGTPTGKAATKEPHTIQEVVDEAVRELHACPHVASPQVPNFLIGSLEELKSLPSQIDANFRKFDAQSGTRALKKTTHGLLAGVASFQKFEEKIDKQAESKEAYDARKVQYLEDYEFWKQKNLEFLKNKYGTELVCVLEHLDEENPHLHFYAVPSIHPDAKKLHDGYKAEKDYKKAMEKLQTKYYEDVARYCGMTRDGPRRNRFSKSEEKARKATAKIIAKELNNNNEVAITLDNQLAKIKTLNVSQSARELALSANEELIKQRFDDAEKNLVAANSQAAKIREHFQKEYDKKAEALQAQQSAIIAKKVHAAANQLLDNRIKANGITNELKTVLEFLKKEPAILKTVLEASESEYIASALRGSSETFEPSESSEYLVSVDTTQGPITSSQNLYDRRDDFGLGY